MKTQKLGEPHAGVTINGEDVFSKSVNFVKSLGKIGGSIFLFILLAIISLALGKPKYALFCIFYIATIIVRKEIQELEAKNPRVRKILPKSLGISINKSMELKK